MTLWRSTTLRVAIVILSCSLCLPAQRLSFGGRFGVPLTNAFDPSGGTLSFTAPRGNLSYNSQNQRFLIGPAVEFRMLTNAAIEIGALYRRVNFESHSVRYYPYAPEREGARGGSSSTSASIWEFPVLFKYRVPVRSAHPYVSAGPSLSYVARIRTSLTCFDFIGPCRSLGVIDEAMELRSRSTAGVVLGAGIELAASRIRLSPEIRYVHYSRRAFEATSGLLRSNTSRIHLLLGISFGPERRKRG
jgi:hypothetical protein